MREVFMGSLDKGDIFRFTPTTARWRVVNIDKECGFITLQQMGKNEPEAPWRMLLIEEWLVWERANPHQ